MKQIQLKMQVHPKRAYLCVSSAENFVPKHTSRERPNSGLLTRGLVTTGAIGHAVQHFITHVGEFVGLLTASTQQNQLCELHLLLSNIFSPWYLKRYGGTCQCIGVILKTHKIK